MSRRSLAPTARNSGDSTWDKITSVSTAVMTVVTCVLVIFTYKTVEFNKLLLAEPSARIGKPVTVVDEGQVGKVVGNDAFCGPSGFSLAGFSKQRVLVFDVQNASEVIAPKLSLQLRAVQAPATALTGVLVERILDGMVIEAMTCDGLGLIPTKLSKEKIPHVYEFAAGPLLGGNILRISLAYAHQIDSSRVSTSPSLHVVASPVGSRFSGSTDQKILPLIK